MNRARALEIVEGLIASGTIVHPNIKKQLGEIIGELTLNEQIRLEEIMKSRDFIEQRRQEYQDRMMSNLRKQGLCPPID